MIRANDCGSENAGACYLPKRSEPMVGLRLLTRPALIRTIVRVGIGSNWIINDAWTKLRNASRAACISLATGIRIQNAHRHLRRATSPHFIATCKEAASHCAN